MTDDDQLYDSWMIDGSAFNRMLHCGDRYNQWVQYALEYLPRDILEESKDRLAFFATADKDGCRVARLLCETREIIILSERILPKAGANESQVHVRYFIFVVLHEVVHALRRHRSPLYDSLTREEAARQEREADDLALEWFNAHISALQNPYLRPLTRGDIDEAQARSRGAMDTLYRGA